MSEWEPLPKRKKRSPPVAASESAPSDESSRVHVPVRPAPSEQIAQSIAANILARSSVIRADTSLTSKDGCAGKYFEYLDHTADVQCHAWGPTLLDAFQNMGECLMNYMTDLNEVEADPAETHEMTVTGTDTHSLLYNYMNELLFKFITDSFVAKTVTITHLDTTERFTLTATVTGDIFDLAKHTVGTEIKAITYSNMQVNHTAAADAEDGVDRVDLFVIVDI